MWGVSTFSLPLHLRMQVRAEAVLKALRYKQTTPNRPPPGPIFNPLIFVNHFKPLTAPKTSLFGPVIIS